MDWVILAAILALALLLRLQKITRGLGQDELFTAVNFVDVQPFWRTVTSNNAFNNHIGYSALARISQFLFGHSEWALRLPALIFGLAAILLGYGMARSVLGRHWAAVFALFLAISPPHIFWSAEARGYSAMICVTMIASWLFFRLRSDSSRFVRWAYVAACVLAIYFHLYSVWVVVVQFALHAWNTAGKSRREFFKRSLSGPVGRCYVAIAGLSVALYAPTARSVVRDLVRRGQGHFDVTFPWSVLVELSGLSRPELTSAALIVAAAGAVALTKRSPTVGVYCGLLLAGPLALMWVAHPFDLYPRFFAYWLPVFLFLLVMGLRAAWDGLGRQRARLPGRFAATAVLALALGNWTSSRNERLADEGYREASLAAMRDTDASTGFCAVGGARSVWKYYVDKPIAAPNTFDEFQSFLSEYRNVRCLYYAASWESVDQRQMAAFLDSRGVRVQVNDLISWFALPAQPKRR